MSFNICGTYMEGIYYSVNGSVWKGKYASELHLGHFKHGSNRETNLLPYQLLFLLGGSQN